MYVLRIARSAAKRPASPIVSLPHAVAWLGFDEVANIAFTLALQGKMLDVKGQQHKARRLWRHSLASALWSRQLAHMLAQETGMCYLCGLLHNIGKVVTLGAVHELAQRAGKKLAGEEYDRLIETFHRHIGARVVTAWALPSPVLTVTSQWEAYAAAGAARFESNVVNVAHTLADFTLLDSTPLARDLLVTARGLPGSRPDAARTPSLCSMPRRPSTPNWTATWRPDDGARPARTVLSMPASVHYRAAHEKQHAGEPSARRSRAGGQSRLWWRRSTSR